MAGRRESLIINVATSRKNTTEGKISQTRFNRLPFMVDWLILLVTWPLLIVAGDSGQAVVYNYWHSSNRCCIPPIADQLLSDQQSKLLACQLLKLGSSLGQPVCRQAGPKG